VREVARSNLAVPTISSSLLLKVAL